MKTLFKILKLIGMELLAIPRFLWKRFSQAAMNSAYTADDFKKMHSKNEKKKAWELDDMCPFEGQYSGSSIFHADHK